MAHFLIVKEDIPTVINCLFHPNIAEYFVKTKNKKHYLNIQNKNSIINLMRKQHTPKLLLAEIVKNNNRLSFDTGLQNL